MWEKFLRVYDAPVQGGATWAKIFVTRKLTRDLFARSLCDSQPSLLVSNDLDADLIFPVYFKYSPVTSHFKCQEFYGQYLTVNIALGSRWGMWDNIGPTWCFLLEAQKFDIRY